MLNIIGIELFKQLIIAIQDGDTEQIKQDIEEYILCFRVYLGFYLGIIFVGKFLREKL